MPLSFNPTLTAAEMFLGGLNVVAMPLLRGKTPDEIQETAQFYGYEDWGQDAERRFISRRPYNPAPGEHANVVTVWVPQGGACRLFAHHPAAEIPLLARAAAAWRLMADAERFPDRWALTLGPSQPDGAHEGRAVTEAWLRRL